MSGVTVSMVLPSSLKVTSVLPTGTAFQPGSNGNPTTILVTQTIPSKRSLQLIVTLEVASSAPSKNFLPIVTTATFFSITTNPRRNTIRVI
jgi:hypothetical protein